MTFQFTKAKREQVHIKTAIIGPSGSGKTYSALRLATGISDNIALVDTEAPRGKYYADEFDYAYSRFDPPYSPERYIEAIEAAIDAGIEVLILDSISHEWEGEGGILRMHDNMQGNKFARWGKLTPRHNAFVSKVLESEIHIIATIRGKDQYVMEEQDKGGKTMTVPKKVGMGGVQRDNIEYEYTVTFMLDQQTNAATATKDNTHIFEGQYEKLTEEHGKQLLEWATSGEKIKRATSEQKDHIKDLIGALGTTEKAVKARAKEKLDINYDNMTEDEAQQLINVLEEAHSEKMQDEAGSISDDELEEIQGEIDEDGVFAEETA